MKTPLPVALLCLCSCVFSGAAFAQPYTFTTIAGTVGAIGSQDGTNSAARFNFPAGLAVDAHGVVYVADLLNHTIRQVKSEGTNWVVTTLAGLPGTFGFADGTNNEVRFDHPSGVAIDRDGSLFVTDKYNNCIRKLTRSGTDWVATTIAGWPGQGAHVDGVSTNARFWGPSGLAVDSSGVLYVADSSTFTIRRVVQESTDWRVSTIAGIPLEFGHGDGINLDTLFNYPWSLAIPRDGLMYVADLGNSVIREMELTGNDWVTTTIAGLPGVLGTNDGPVTFATFNDPVGIAVLKDNRIFATDWSSHTLREIAHDGSDWYVSTAGGAARVLGSTDGVGTSARFRKPYGLALDQAGVLYIADYSNQTIRMGVSLPTLRIALSGTQAVLSWPLWAGNFQLETSGSLAPGDAWTPITNNIAVSGNSFVLTNDIAGSAFYRLRQQ